MSATFSKLFNKEYSITFGGPDLTNQKKNGNAVLDNHLHGCDSQVVHNHNNNSHHNLHILQHNDLSNNIHNPETLKITNNTCNNNTHNIEDVNECSGYDNIEYDDVDGRPKKELLQEIANMAKKTSGQFRNKLNLYSDEHFANIPLGPSDSRSYDTPLMLPAFDEPPKSQVKREDVLYLAAVRKVIQNARRIMHPKRDSNDKPFDLVTFVIGKLDVVDRMLDNDKIVDATKLTWNPVTTVMFSDLRIKANMLEKAQWPKWKSSGSVGKTGTDQELEEKLIKLTFLKQMDRLMIRLAASATKLSDSAGK